MTRKDKSYHRKEEKRKDKRRRRSHSAEGGSRRRRCLPCGFSQTGSFCELKPLFSRKTHPRKGQREGTGERTAETTVARGDQSSQGLWASEAPGSGQGPLAQGEVITHRHSNSCRFLYLLRIESSKWPGCSDLKASRACLEEDWAGTSYKLMADGNLFGLGSVYWLQLAELLGLWLIGWRALRGFGC